MVALPMWARLLILLIIAVATAKSCSYVGSRRDDRPRSHERPALFRPRAEAPAPCPCPTPSCTRPHRVLPNLRPQKTEEVVDEPRPLTEDEFHRLQDELKQIEAPPAPSLTTTTEAPAVTTTSGCPGGVCPPQMRTGFFRRR